MHVQEHKVELPPWGKRWPERSNAEQVAPAPTSSSRTAGPSHSRLEMAPTTQLVVEDDLRWLDALAAGHAAQAAGRAHEDSHAVRTAKQRTTFNTLQSAVLTREKKLKEATDTYNMLVEQCRDTTADQRASEERLSRYAWLERELQEQQDLLDAETEYALTLDSMQSRRKKELDGLNEELDSLYRTVREFSSSADGLSKMTKELVHDSHRARNARNGISMATAAETDIRARMKAKRTRLVSERSQSAQRAELQAESDEAQLQARRDSFRQAAAMDTGVRTLQVVGAAERAKRLEEEFDKVQQIAGFDGIEQVADRFHALIVVCPPPSSRAHHSGVPPPPGRSSTASRRKRTRAPTWRRAGARRRRGSRAWRRRGRRRSCASRSSSAASTASCSSGGAGWSEWRLGEAIAGLHGLHRLHLKAWGCPPHS